MGLFSWIKDKYNESRLNKADRLVQEKRFSEAEEIYRKLFYNHLLAVPHLANMFVSSSNSVDERISALKKIVELGSFANDGNRHLYDTELKAHIRNMESQASTLFHNKQYKQAVSLIDSLISLRGSDAAFMNRVHQYHAYLSFSIIAQTARYQEHLDDTIKELKAYAPSCKSDIKYFVDNLTASSYYYRAIKLLQPFLSLSSEYREQIVKFVVAILSGKDKGIKKPSKISSYCDDKKICADVADRLFKLSRDAANKKDYQTSVLFDNFAAEFLSSDNNFNVARCSHIFKELEPRADAKEIKDLLGKAKDLKLTNEQILNLKKNIATVARQASPGQGIDICRLFISEKDFDAIYIRQAERLASTRVAAINTNELMSVIKNNTDEDSFVDVLVPFVKFIPQYGSTFVKSAIDKIVRHKSMPFLKQYWKVKEDVAFFNQLISPSSDLSKDTVNYITDNNKDFLHNGTLLSAFLKAIDKLKDNDFAYEAAERMYAKGCGVLHYFIDKTNSRCDKLNGEESVKLIDRTLKSIDYLHNDNPIWISLFIRKRNIEKKTITTLSQSIPFCRESIDTILNSSLDVNSVSEPSYFALWEEYADLALKKAESQPKDKAIQNLSEVKNFISANCQSYPKQQILTDNLNTRIAKLRWEIGKEYEEDGEYDNAISQYKAIVMEGAASFAPKAEFRNLICHIKGNRLYGSIDADIKKALGKKSFQALKDDLAYRYACMLIKNTHSCEAEKILRTYLPTETGLIALCENIYIKESEKYLEEFNAKMAAVADGTMTLQEALDFFNNFSDYKQVISRSLTDTTNKFVSYRRKLETYIIRLLFDEEKYALAFSKLLSMYPKYYEDDTNFRNVAIAALGIVESDDTRINEDLYKKAISIWLSAIYNDRLFVKSLDYTSWDDPFSFTLDGSLGNSSDDDYEELPDNINFEEPIENQNIAISDVQNSLITRMETHIRNNKPDFEQFFNEEKESLDALISLRLDEDCIIGAPYFASQYKDVLESIKDSFDAELSFGYGNEEDVLCLGVKYGFRDNEYAEYKEAELCADSCKAAHMKNVTQLKTSLNSLSKVKKFDKLYASLKAFFSSKMNEAIKAKMEYKQFIDIYEIVCNAFNDVSLSLGFSQYANSQVIRLLSDDSMKERDCAVCLARIFKIAPNNIQVKQNLEGVLRALVRICVEKNDQTDQNALNNAVSIAGPSFQRIVDLAMIVQKVNNDKMTKKDALPAVYNIYKRNKNEDDVSENLATLCDLCIWEYIIGDALGSYAVRNTIDNILNDRSAAFISHSDCFAKSFFKIMNGLSKENRMSILFGINLNTKGQALRRGLVYFVKFSPDGVLPDAITKILK